VQVHNEPDKFVFTAKQQRRLAVLAGALAATVFLTSLLLETGERRQATPVLANLQPAGQSLRVFDFWHRDGIAALLPLTSSETQAHRDQRVQQMMTAASQFIHAGNIEGAGELLRTVVAVAPEHSHAWHLLGTVYFIQRRYRQAEPCLARAVGSGSGTNALCRTRLALTQMHLGKYESALQNLRIVEKIAPEEGALHFAFTCVYAHQGDTEQALAHLEQAYRRLGGALLAHISDPNLDALRDQKRFRQIVQAVRNSEARHLTNSSSIADL